MSGERPMDLESSAPLVPGRIADHTGCLLLKTGQVVFRLMEAHLGSLGLRIRHYSVLQTLLDRGAMSQQSLGSCLRIDGATMVATIDDLEAMGFVGRERETNDRRRYEISLTAEGEKTLRRANELIESFDEEYLADITPAQREQLHKTLRKLSLGATLTMAFDDVRGR